MLYSANTAATLLLHGTPILGTPCNQLAVIGDVFKSQGVLGEHNTWCLEVTWAIFRCVSLGCGQSSTTPEAETVWCYISMHHTT